MKIKKINKGGRGERIVKGKGKEEGKREWIDSSPQHQTFIKALFHPQIPHNLPFLPFSLLRHTKNNTKQKKEETRIRIRRR